MLGLETKNSVSEGREHDTCTQRTLMCMMLSPVLKCLCRLYLLLQNNCCCKQNNKEREPERAMDLRICNGVVFVKCFAVVFGLIIVSAPGAWSWSKEGHIVTCRIAQDLLEPEAAEAVRNLLPHHADGDLSALCTWPDQIRHWYKYRWTSSLHFIDTPDNACSFDYARDCHDPKGLEDMCVAGAVRNFTTQLMHYREGSSDRLYNLTESLLFLSHFMGDIHQPMHVGFTSDRGGNTINLRWFRHKSNLHHVWDREIILTALADYYGKDLDAFKEDLEKNFTAGIWSDDTSSWGDCDDLFTCPKKWASESISIACKWGYRAVTQGETLSDEYFNSRMPIVMKRIAQGGVRLAMILNQVFSEHNHEIPPPT